MFDWLWNVSRDTKIKEKTNSFPRADKLFSIEEKYWLNKEDVEFVNVILAGYQSNLTELYFTDHLVSDRFFRKMSALEYFLYSLKEYLEQRDGDVTFGTYEMYTIKKQTRDKGWEFRTYELSDFAVVFHKMLLIAQTYCLTFCENPFDTTSPSFDNWETTKHILETREMEVSRFL